MFFLYFRKQNFLTLPEMELSSLKNKKNSGRNFRAQKITTLKKFLIFHEMELSSPRLKTFLYLRREVAKPEN